MKGSAIVVGVGRASPPSLGYAVARRFAAGGRPVHVWDVDPDNLASVAEAMPEAVPLLIDAADAAAVDTAVARVERPSILVHCAAMTRHPWAFRALPEIARHELDRELRSTLLGALVCSSAAIAAMEPGGVVVLVSSAIVGTWAPRQIPYAAAKAAIESSIPHLAAAARRRGVRVAGVSPGPIATATYQALSPAGRSAVAQRFGAVVSADEVAGVIEAMTEPAMWQLTGQVVRLAG